jgi:hypothetical protein
MANYNFALRAVFHRSVVYGREDKIIEVFIILFLKLCGNNLMWLQIANI